MHLRAAKIKNFRLLENIDVAFDNKVNVIVGPNASGKSTILEAIRFVKAVLAPRTPNETSQVLFALGAGSPHLPQQLIPDALAGNVTIPVELETRYEFTEEEIDFLESSSDQLSMNLLQARMGQTFTNQASLIAFLGSEQGQKALQAAKAEMTEVLAKTRTTRSCILGVKIDPRNGQFTPTDPIAPQLFSQIERRQLPHLSVFTYFPADRALPLGEQPVQLGAADAQQQLETYNSQPQLKYQRLKNTIFSSVIVSTEGRADLENDFAAIFNNVLKGRRLVGFGLNPVGMLAIRVQDTDSGRTFDLDGLSSGEKGLLLTCLIIARSVARDGLVLLDEPELHLNPAIAKGLLTFFVDTYVNAKNIQLITCSHSPEILMGAFDRSECTLLHLKSSTEISKVRRQDESDLTDALRRLGSSEVESLIVKSTVFVEGERDAELLDKGFEKLFRGYKLNDQGGRKELEKLIRVIQHEEREGKEPPRKFFILDRDDEPLELSSSSKVRILQWKRRCLENYLIDAEVITDILNHAEIAKMPIGSVSNTERLLRDLALSQLDWMAARHVYENRRLKNPGLKGKDLHQKSPREIAQALFTDLTEIRDLIAGLDESAWITDFERECSDWINSKKSEWAVRWTELCDGKVLLHNLHRSVTPRISLNAFKRRIMIDMKIGERPNWIEMKDELTRLMSAT